MGAPQLTPKHKRRPGAPPSPPPAAPTVDPGEAIRLAIAMKALADPIRLQLVDVLAAHAGQLCACELQPLFDISQSTLSHHLKTLADAGVLEVHRRGLFAYYLVRPEALREISRWLDDTAAAA